MTIIGIAGPAGAGKSTLAKAISALCPSTRESFASPMKKMIGAMLECCDEPIGFLDTQQGKATELPWMSDTRRITPRYLLQTLGTEWGRNLIDPDIWVRISMRSVDYCPFTVIFDDVRFDNEADAIRKRGGLIVHLPPRSQPMEASAHSSEAGVQQVLGDFVCPLIIGPDQTLFYAALILERAGVEVAQ
jgi:energy-coupling factor transporter ATP-binding protein EcfA2